MYTLISLAYCFQNFSTYANTKLEFELAQHTLGDILNVTCNFGYEYTDQMAKTAESTADTSDDHFMTVRRKECHEVAVPQGGTWKDIDPQPDQCYRKSRLHSNRFCCNQILVSAINCTKNSPPQPNSIIDRDIQPGVAGQLILEYLTVIK